MIDNQPTPATGGFGGTKHITTPIAPRNSRVMAKAASREPMEKPARRHLSSRARPICPASADGGQVGLALEFAPGLGPDARMTRKNLRNVSLSPEGSRPLGRWGLRLQQGSWSCSWVSA